MFGTFYGQLAATGYTWRDARTAALVLSLLSSTAVCELVRRKRLFLLTAAAFLPLCFAMVLRLRLPFWAPAVVAAGWLGLWCSVSGPAEIRWETVVLAAGAAGILCVLPTLFTGVLWQNASWEFRTHIKDSIEKLRFGEDTLPGGNLVRADRMTSGTEARLELEMEAAAPVYLRGFVGSVLENNQWKPFDADAYEGDFSGMLSWLAKQNFYPGEQYAEYAAAFPEQSSEKLLKVSVKNTGASRRYIYLPATAAESTGDSGRWKQDWSMEASRWFGEKNYGFSYYDTQNNAEVQLPGSWIYDDTLGGSEAARFRQAERVYRSFVYDHYLDLDEEQKAVADLLFFQGGTWEEGSGIYTVTSRIRTVLQILADYKEQPVRVPADREFLGWFLQEGKEGNAAYYASAAVLAYRAAGIPARYAEGYVLTRRQAEKTEGTRVTLSSRNAQAWVEVYVDGMGWRTVEVTPGFYEEVYHADIVVAVPSEEIDNGAGDGSGLVISEEFELSETEGEEQVPSRRKVLPAAPLLLLLPAVLLLWSCGKMVQELYIRYRYAKMTGKEKMYFLYCRIMDMTGKLYQDFNQEQPLKLLSRQGLSFDTALYERTVKRMEGIIYGQMEPAPREIPAAEALVLELRKLLSRKNERGFSHIRKSLVNHMSFLYNEDK